MKNRQDVIEDILNKLSDIKFQEDVWVKHSYWHRITNFGEAVNTLDDYDFFDELYSDNLIMDEADLSILNDFRRRLLNFIEFENGNLMLTDPSWIQIAKDASLIRSMLFEGDKDSSSG